jgi:ketosteroid isomerase-like protein
MSKIALALSVLAFLGLSAPSLAGPKADIRKLEQDFNAAYAANDLDKYFGFYKDDAILWFQDGRTDLPSYRKQWTDTIKGGSAVKEAKVSDLHIVFSPAGDTAIASYLLHVKTQAADKSITDENDQETDVWFKTGGEWKIAHVHYSDAPKPKAP